MLEGNGRFINRPTKTGKKFYDKHFIYIPTKVARDSSFPFNLKDIIKVRIDKKHNRLIIEKLEQHPLNEKKKSV